MKALFLSFYGFSSYNGISKKILSQADALRQCGVETSLSYLVADNEGIKRMVNDHVLVNYGTGIVAKIKKRVSYSALTAHVRSQEIKFIYMRGEHNANPFLIAWLRRMRRMGVCVVMEVPTYPYDNEYLQSAPIRKLHLLMDKLFRGLMARQLHRIVTFTDYPEIFGVPTIRISNGIDGEAIPLKQRCNDTTARLQLIGVADIHFWHGFDRVITGLGEYYKSPQSVEVTFSVVGRGVAAEVQRLRELVVQHHLEGRVLFHGPQSGEKLDALFEEADFGIASLGRHRCGITKIKTLKNREYAARGIPFIYSEVDDDFEEMPYVLKASADESPIDIEALIHFHKACALTPSQIRNSVIEQLSWRNQMQRVLNESIVKTISKA